MTAATLTMGSSALSDFLEPEPQPASLFLSKLPPEIRSQIYDRVFGYRHLHIFIYEQKLVSLVCQHPTAVDPDGHEECIGMSMSRSKRPWNDDGIRQRPPPAAPDKRRQHFSALLTVCRIMYLETADSLYRTHTFHFSNIVSLTVFPREIVPRHRAMLHHLRIDLFLLGSGSRGPAPGELYIFLHNSLGRRWADWDEASGASSSGSSDTPWEYAWGAVAELPSLHTLTVTLEISTAGISAGLEQWLIRPLAQVTCNDFLLRVNWAAPPAATGGGQPEPVYPFRIERFTSKST